MAIECLEITAEQFSTNGTGLPRWLAARYPILVHTSSLSLGTPGPLDEGALRALARLIETTGAAWLSDHVGFRRTRELDVGLPLPVRPTSETLALLADHCREAGERLGRPLLVENIAHPLRVAGSLAEPEFLSRLAEASGCGLLLDLVALAVQARGHGFDARAWLRDLALDRVVQIRVGGYERDGNHWLDTHRDPVPEDVWMLAAEVLAAAPVRAAILERSGSLPEADELEAELGRLRDLAAAAIPASGAAGSGRR